MPSGEESLTFEFRDGGGNTSSKTLNLVCTEPSCPFEPSALACCNEAWDCGGFRDFAFYSSETLKLADGVRPKDQDGRPSSVANSGSGELFLGAGSSVNDAWTAGSAFLADLSTIFGDLTVAGQFTRQNQAQIIGDTRTDYSEMTFPRLDEFEVPFPNDFGVDLHLEPNESTSLLPSSRRSVHLKPGAHLRLSPGAYYFDQFILDRNSKVTYSTENGPVYIYIKSSFTQRGNFEEDNDEKRAFFVGYFGANTAWIESPLAGTLVAPNGKVQIRNLNGPSHFGSVVAKNIEVDSHAKFVHVPFQARWIGGAVAGVEWRGNKAEIDDRGCAMNGRVNRGHFHFWIIFVGLAALMRRRWLRG